MKILLLDKTASGEDLDYTPFARFGQVWDCGNCKTEEEMLRLAAHPLYGDAEGILCNKAPMTAAVQKAFPKLRYIGLFATGYNNVDTEQAKKRGIVVCNVPGYSTEAVAQMVFSHILLIASSIDRYTADTRAGKWVNYPVFTMLTHPMEELSGKTLGIFGYGSIGKRVAEIGAAFGMKVLVHTRTERPGCPFPYVDAHTLLSSADYLSLNAPLNAQTARFINEESIREMKDGAVLINTARGGLVDEEALAAALRRGKLRAAGLDVLQSEPMASDCPLLGLPNCHITPHVAWAPGETRKRLLQIVLENLKAFSEGNPRNRVC